MQQRTLDEFPYLIVEYDDRLPSAVVVGFARSYEQAWTLFHALADFAHHTSLNVLYGIRETASIEAWQRL